MTGWLSVSQDIVMVDSWHVGAGEPESASNETLKLAMLPRGRGGANVRSDTVLGPDSPSFQVTVPSVDS